MKKLFLALLSLVFVCSQAMAATCAVSCSYQAAGKELVEKTVDSSSGSGHECCHGKDSSPSQSDKKSSDCHGHDSGGCFHADGHGEPSFAVVSQDLVTDQQLFLGQISISHFSKKVSLSYRFKKRVLEDEYLAHRARLDLYLHKEQFLN